MNARATTGLLLAVLLHTAVAAHAQDEPSTQAQVEDCPLALAMRLASHPPRFEQASGELVELTAAPPEATTRPTRALLDLIASWLKANFDLAGYTEPPPVEFVSPARLVALRYRGLALDGAAYPGREKPAEPLINAPKIEGLYDDRNHVIYLPEAWEGVTVAEISVLVHEMVHHLQHVGRVTFSCPQERERLAYKAQDKWLSIFGKNLADEFELDRFSVFAKTLCLD